MEINSLFIGVVHAYCNRYTRLTSYFFVRYVSRILGAESFLLASVSKLKSTCGFAHCLCRASQNCSHISHQRACLSTI
ncbi:unnamed protein product, partial [Cylicocyclus nassatus]